MRALGWLLAAWLLAAAASAGYPVVQPGVTVVLPQDSGSHPDFRTEWWYVTGWLSTAAGQPLGFQVTFFRTRPTLARDNPSAFASGQLLIAHVALSDPRRGRLWHDQRIARVGFGLAEAAVGRTDVHLRDWSLAAGDGAFTAKVAAEDFELALTLEPRQPPLLNGRGGYSQKGPAAASASYYYSLPGLAVHGQVVRGGIAEAVTGSAWLDHEWSSAALDAASVGWDWVGLNLDDGGALMAFRIRDAQGAVRWAGGSWRRADGQVQSLAPAAVVFTPGRRWRSPRTGIAYPVEWQLAAAGMSLALTPLFDDQESDSRLSSGAIYWEGAVEARRAGQRVGRGYLELTGYGERLQLR
ncbi:MAG: lipocalin-like domain-containing protein [Pseudomonadota bacterium]